jgi:hypothetical protein
MGDYHLDIGGFQAERASTPELQNPEVTERLRGH